ncbi:MAG: sortase [Bacilli bacterium]|nr:sortase [Bacilli bacterium]
MIRKKEIFKIIIIILLLLLITSSNINPNKNTFNLQYQEIINTNLIKEKKYLIKINIPKISLKETLYPYNSLDNNVNKSIEILYPSIMPNQNKSLLILAAHSGNSKVSYFKNLYLLKKDDLIYIKYNNYTYIYKIKTIEKQNKTGEIAITKNNSTPVLILTTCDQEDKTKQIVITSTGIE